MTHVHYGSAELSAFAASCLQAVGVSARSSALTADALVTTDQHGITSHGVLRLPLYVDALQHGGITARPEMRWIREHGATALLDADNALGQVAMDAVVNRARAIVTAEGAAVIAVQNSVHYGAGFYWTQQLADDGIAAVLTSTTG